MSQWVYLFGLAFFAIAFVLLFFDVLRFRKTNGTVIGNDSMNDEGGWTYAPRVRFRTSEGVDREFQSIAYVHSNPLRFGTQVRVRYHPTINWLNGIDRWYCRWLPVLFFVLCGSASTLGKWFL